MNKSTQTEPEITELLLAMNGGDAEAFGRLIPHVYSHLRRLARQRLAGERPGHTLDTTGLVHEAYLKLVGAGRIEWNNRGHFFGVASRIMRRILVDYARKRRAGKRGSGQACLASDGGKLLPDATAEALLDLDEALGRLRAIHARRSQALECHYFGGLTLEETAEALSVSLGTAERDLRLARAWLAEQLRGGSLPVEPTAPG